MSEFLKNLFSERLNIVYLARNRQCFIALFVSFYTKFWSSSINGSHNVRHAAEGRHPVRRSRYL